MRASTWRLSCFVFYGNLGFLEYHFQFEKEGRASRTKSHPAEGSWISNRSARRALLDRHCRRYHRPIVLRMAPACKEPLAARAQVLRHQSKSRESKSRERLAGNLEVTTGIPRSSARREQRHHRSGRQRQERSAGT